MRFIDRFMLCQMAPDELDSLGYPKRHRCMKCGVNHKIPWDHIRYKGEVISLGVTACACGDEVVSIWGKSMTVASEFAEIYSKQNPVT